METVFSVSCAYALALNTKLYWTEGCASQESVHSLDLSTLQETVIVESSDVDAYFGVAVYEDTVYWTGNARVYSTPVAGGGNITELLYISSYGGAQFRGITVVHPDLQPDPRITVSPHTSSISSPLMTTTLRSTSPPLTSSLLFPTPSPLLPTPMLVNSTLVSAMCMHICVHLTYFIYRMPFDYLLFSTWFTVSAMNVDGSDYSVLVDSGSVGPQAVDYHWR